MGNEIETRRELPTPTPQVAKSLSPQDLQEHRRKIAFEVSVFFEVAGYWQKRADTQDEKNVSAASLAWWCDELQDWTIEQIVYSLRKWNRENPRIKATPGDIVGVMMDLRGRKIAAQLPKPEPEQPRERVTAERAADILRDVGFSPKRME